MHRLLILLMLFPAIAAAQGHYSRHCSQPEARTTLTPGKWKVDFDITMDAQGAQQNFNLALQMKLKGQLTIGVAEDETLESATGHIDYTFGGSGSPMPLATGGSDMKGSTDDIFLGGFPPRKSSSIPIKANLSIGGKLYTVTPAGRQESSKSGGGDLDIQLNLSSADCDSSRGVALATKVEEAAKSLAGAGYKISGPSGSWTGRNEEYSKKISELKERMVKASDGDQKSLGKRLAEIVDDIKKQSEALAHCLYPVWFEYTTKIRGQWANKDAADLNSYSGDWPGLSPLIKTAVQDDTALALLGLDECSRSYHKTLFTAMEKAHTALLKRMITTKAKPEDIISVLKSAELLGVVGPELRDRTMEAIKNAAGKEVSDRLAAFNKGRGDARRNGTSACTPAMRILEQELVTAEKLYQLMGGSTNALLEDLIDYDARCLGEANAKKAIPNK